MYSFSQNAKDIQKSISFTPKIKVHIEDILDKCEIKNIDDFDISKEGNVFCCDSKSNKVIILDQDGHFIKEFGKKGQGPGDLNAPVNIVVFKNLVYIWELWNHRFSVFSLNGDFIRIHKFPGMDIITRLGKINEDCIVIESESKKNIFDDITNCEVWTCDEQIENKNILFKKEIIKQKTIHSPQRVTISLPFYPNITWNNFLTYITIGYQNNEEINLYDCNGNIKSFINYCFEKTRVSEIDKTNALGKYVMVSSEGKSQANKKILNEIEFPKEKPLYSHIIATTKNDLLISPYKSGTSEIIDWFYRFNNEGKYCGKIYLDKSIKNPYKIICNTECWMLIKNLEEEVELIHYDISY
jgi:hypothetical protein